VICPGGVVRTGRVVVASGRHQPTLRGTGGNRPSSSSSTTS
jgi:hypothetical protein